MRPRLLLCLGVLLCLSAPARAGSPVAEGNWKLSYVAPATATEITMAILKVQDRDGRPTATLLAHNPRYKEVTLKSFTVDGNSVRAVLALGTTELAFEGQAAGKATRQIRGSFGTDTQLFPATMATTDRTEVAPAEATKALDIGPMREAMTLQTRANSLRIKALQTKDAGQRGKLLEQAAEAQKAFEQKAPELYREVLTRHAASPVASEAALQLLRLTAKKGADADEVRGWAGAASKAAVAYGPRWRIRVETQLATELLQHKEGARLAAERARSAEKLLGPKSPAQQQADVLTLLARTLRAAGQAEEAKGLDQRIARVNEGLDREYLAKVPSFKGTPFKGRQGQSNRAVVMELFTGAQCPPCVAADVAFDVLLKTYKASELVLIQYHVHIPGPDPLTTPEGEARFNYYRKVSPDKVRGAPSSIFNGKPAASGGGGMAAAEKKYDAYRQVIDPLLEEPAGAKLAAAATRQGDKIAIKVDVSDLAKAGEETRLRLVLVEENIRYVGGNKIRFHHQVVRAMPGGIEGFALKAKDSTHTTTVDLAELRKQLTTYLDNYAATKRPFPNADRPMDFRGLRLIAMVQDDRTQEILQAVQVEVGGDRPGR